jgi:predicted component of type VI protein secretion system
MRARLVSLDEIADISLSRAIVLVGRDLRCDARIHSPRVSRLHCCLAWHHGVLSVRDLGSKNGTRINDRFARAGWLRHGDELSIAHLRYRLDANDRPSRLIGRLLQFRPSATEDIGQSEASLGRSTNQDDPAIRREADVTLQNCAPKPSRVD